MNTASGLGIFAGLIVGAAGGFFASFTPASAGPVSDRPFAETPPPSPRRVVYEAVEAPCPKLPPVPELEALTGKVEGVQADLSAVEEDVASLVGEALSFDGLPPERQPLAIEERLIDVLDELGRGEIYYTDCSEHPCITVLEVVVPSFDREYFGVFSDAVEKEFDTKGESFWASSTESVEGATVVHISLPLDRGIGGGETSRRTQHRADQLLWDADADARGRAR